MRFRFKDTRADLRLRIEQLLLRKEGASAEAWSKLGPEARSLLVEMLDDEALREREAIMHRLITVTAELKVKRAAGPLAAILGDRKVRNVTRAYAANALGRLGESAGIDALVQARDTPDGMVRRQIARAFARMEQPAVLPYLTLMSDDRSPAVAEVAAEGLRRWEKKLGHRLTTTKAPKVRRSESKRKPAIER